jgi:hypothetical protein
MVAALFAQGEQGAWYDPSDITTMFQDSAGTTPVTAVGQPVGLILDKSGRGNHAFQTTTTKRPLYSARVNLLTKTEQFGDAVWGKVGVSVVADAAISPNGTTTMAKIVPSIINAGHFLFVDIAASGVTSSIYAKTSGYSWLRMNLTGVGSAWFNITAGQVGTVQSGIVASIVEVTPGTYKCSCVVSSAITRVNFNVEPGDNLSSAWTGDGVSGIYLWGASLVPADQASLPYQRVNTATDYDSVGFNKYLAFDGVDDALVTNSIDFTTTDKMTVVAGVRKLSDAAVGMLAELSAVAFGNNGGFSLIAPPAISSPTYRAALRGTTYIEASTAAAFAAPISNVVTLGFNISGSTKISLAVDSGTDVTNTASAGAGNFGNYPLYIGSRAGTQLPFTGNLYSLVIRGAQSTDAQIAATESYSNSKTGAYGS